VGTTSYNQGCQLRVFAPQDYQPALEERFKVVAERLSAAVPFGYLEHIGSSAIPGADSKGDLDVCLLVPQARHEEAVGILLATGYTAQVNTLRTAELCMLIESDPALEHAVQVVAQGSSFTNFIVFRDLLRSSPQLVERYNAVKREAATFGEDAYRERKREFIEKVLLAAKD
jgi:GrpB-like predicted nucleotidyltransferase (UPF0157 family)